MNGDLGLGIIVSMKDAFSQNAARVQSSMQSLDATVAASSERMTRNLDRIQKGTMMIGAGLALMAVPVGLIASTAATQKALGEMASLGIKDLRALEDASESFTNTWAGYSKAEFIGAAYDVKSALSSLSDEAVGAGGANKAASAAGAFAVVSAVAAAARSGAISADAGVNRGDFSSLMACHPFCCHPFWDSTNCCNMSAEHR